MSHFENSTAASKFLSLITHIRLYQGGGKAEEFNQEIKAAAENDGNKIKLTEQQVIDIALKYKEVKQIKPSKKK